MNNHNIFKKLFPSLLRYHYETVLLKEFEFAGNNKGRTNFARESYQEDTEQR